MKESVGIGRDPLILMTMTFLFGVLLAWALFFRWGSAPPTKPVDLPAWTQAIGSLIGIGLAMYVPWRQRRNQIEDDQRRAAREELREEELMRLMHVALWRPVATYKSSCDYLLGKVGNTFAARQVMPPDLFDRPAEFDQFREKLHLLGPVGHRINQLIVHQEMIRLMYRDFQRVPYPTANFRADLPKRLKDAVAMTEEISGVLLTLEARHR